MTIMGFEISDEPFDPKDSWLLQPEKRGQIRWAGYYLRIGKRYFKVPLFRWPVRR